MALDAPYKYGWKLKGLVLFCLIFTLDTWTKLWAQSALMHQGIYIGSLFGIDLYLSLTTNLGAAWGIGASVPTLLLVFRCVVILALLVFLFSKKCEPSWRLPLCVALSGALCNVRDNFLWGHVIDMIDVRLWGYDFPIFNVADIAISLSLLFLVFRCQILHDPV